jgi:hypothetical protein
VVTGFVFHNMLVASAFMLVKGNLTIGVPESHSGGRLAAVHRPSRGYGEMGSVSLWSQNVEHVI